MIVKVHQLCRDASSFHRKSHKTQLTPQCGDNVIPSLKRNTAWFCRHRWKHCFLKAKHLCNRDVGLNWSCIWHPKWRRLKMTQSWCNWQQKQKKKSYPVCIPTNVKIFHLQSKECHWVQMQNLKWSMLCRQIWTAGYACLHVVYELCPRFTWDNHMSALTNYSWMM